MKWVDKNLHENEKKFLLNQGSFFFFIIILLYNYVGKKACMEGTSWLWMFFSFLLVFLFPSFGYLLNSTNSIYFLKAIHFKS